MPELRSFEDVRQTLWKVVSQSADAAISILESVRASRSAENFFVHARVSVPNSFKLEYAQTNASLFVSPNGETFYSATIKKLAAEYARQMQEPAQTACALQDQHWVSANLADNFPNNGVFADAKYENFYFN